MHCVHCALPIILITIIGSELKLSVESRLKWGVLQRYLQEGVFPGTRLGNNTSFYMAFTEITREKRVSQGGGCLLYVCISCKSGPLKSI